MAQLFENTYRCVRCGAEWSDVWCAMCDDRCPSCDTEMTPTTSRSLHEDCTHADCPRFNESNTQTA